MKTLLALQELAQEAGFTARYFCKFELVMLGSTLDKDALFIMDCNENATAVVTEVDGHPFVFEVSICNEERDISKGFCTSSPRLILFRLIQAAIGVEFHALPDSSGF